VFNGEPIISFPIQEAIKSNLFDRVIVSTDDKDIAKIAQKYGAEVPFFRSAQTSNDYATTIEVLKEVVVELNKYSKQNTNICCLYPCTPLVTATVLIKAFRKFIEEDMDTLLSIQEYRHPIQRALALKKGGIINFVNKTFISTRTQDLEVYYHDAGQFYFHKASLILNNESIYDGKTGFYLLTSAQAQDIDNEDDWSLAEIKYKANNKPR
jgi:N-acylneuraminate cytidylyltransferase